MIIPTGKHAPFRLPRHIGSIQKIQYDVTFTDSCKYWVNSEDQADINKLFGIGFYPHHSYNSVRFGWNYLSGEFIRIYAYWYFDKRRYQKYLGEVPIGKTYRYIISPYTKWHNLHVMGRGLSASVPVPMRRFGYHLGPYFGGNQVAPHDIEIIMK
jgi:hypothetical protein